MKRLNPATNALFTRGTVREDGFIFNSYSSILKKDGYYKEIWLNPEVFKRIKEKDTANKNYRYKRTTNHYPKGTSQYFKRDLFARQAYKIAMNLINENPSYKKEDLNEVVELAPYILKIIFPDPNGISYESIFSEGKENLELFAMMEQAKKIKNKQKR